jgi:hypothetical protein
MADVSGIAANAITGAVAIVTSAIGAFATAYVARQKRWELLQRRRDERREVYKTAIDLLSDLGWREGRDPEFDVERDFSRPFVRAINGVRLYGSPESVAAADELQDAFHKSNNAKSEKAREIAAAAIQRGHDRLVIAARADVGPRREDGLKEVPFRKGAGPPA